MKVTILTVVHSERMAASSIIAICQIICFVFATIPATTASVQMLRNLTNGYDKRTRPFLNEPTNVSVQIAMIALGPISEKEQSVKSDIYLRQWWNDPRLDVGQRVLIFNINPSSYFWVPDTFISNSRKTERHETMTKSSSVKLGPNSSVFASMRFTTLCHCKMDLRKYPHDEQDCSIDLEPYAFNGNEVSLYWKTINEPIVGLDLSTAGYEVKSIRGVREVTYYLNDPFPKLRAILRLKRSFPYYLYHVYIPGSMLVMLSFTTFFILPSAVPARVTLIVTNFLSTMFIFGSTASLIPKKPYITAMEIYSLINIVFIILVMVEYIIVLKFKALKNKRLSKSSTVSDKTDNYKMAEWHERNEKGNEMQIHKDKAKKNGNILDSIAAFLFPISYFICLVSYFAIYM